VQHWLRTLKPEQDGSVRGEAPCVLCQTSEAASVVLCGTGQEEAAWQQSPALPFLICLSGAELKRLTRGLKRAARRLLAAARHPAAQGLSLLKLVVSEVELVLFATEGRYLHPAVR